MSSSMPQAPEAGAPPIAPPPAPPSAGDGPGSAPAPKGDPVRPESFAPIACGVTVVRDTSGKLAGRLQGQIAPQGLIIYSPLGEPTVIRPGSSVKYLGDNRMAASLSAEGNGQPREISLRLRRAFAQKNHLTLDTVAYLNGDISRLAPSYDVPFWLFLPALLPLALPFVVRPWLVDEKHTDADRVYELATAGAVALILVALCWVIALSEKTRALTRVLACLLFTGLAYGFALALVGAYKVPNLMDQVIAPAPDENEKWTLYPIAEEQCSILLLEEPKKAEQRERELGGTEKAKFNIYAAEDPHARYQLAVAPAPAQLRQPYLDDKELQLKQFQEDFPQASNVDYQSKTEFFQQAEANYADIFGRELRATLPGGERVIRQIFVLKDKVYMMTFQAKASDVREKYHQMFFGNLKHDALGQKRMGPQIAGAGGRGAARGGQGASRPADGSRPGGPGRRRGGPFGGGEEETKPEASKPTAPGESKPADARPGEGKGSKGG